MNPVANLNIKPTTNNIILLGIISIALAIYVGFIAWPFGDLVSKEDKIFFEELGSSKIIQGEVTKVENDRIYFKVRVLRSAPTKSADLDNITEEEKISVFSQDTLFFKVISGASELKSISAGEIKVGAKINVHFDQETNFETFDAKRIQLLENE